MIFTSDDIGFSFELPEGWHKDEHNLVLTFYGPNGGLGKQSEIIQLQFGGILPQYADPHNREAFLAEPGAQIIRGKLGDESNVVVLKKPTNSEISAVRDGIQYSISHSNDPATVSAIDMLCRTARFPSSWEASDAISRASGTAEQVITKALRAGSAEETRNLLNATGVPSVSVAPGITIHNLDDIGCHDQNSPRKMAGQQHVAASTPQMSLLEELDGAGKASHDAEDALVAMGDEAIDDLLQSVAEINGRMNGTIRDVSLNPPAEMARLERRVCVMERIRSPLTLKGLFDALADSALAAEAYTQKRDAAYERGDSVMAMVANDHLEFAKSLNNATIKALVAFGQQVIPHARRYATTSSPAVSRAMRKVVSRLERKWWQFWR